MQGDPRLPERLRQRVFRPCQQIAVTCAQEDVTSAMGTRQPDPARDAFDARCASDPHGTIVFECKHLHGRLLIWLPDEMPV